MFGQYSEVDWESLKTQIYNEKEKEEKDLLAKWYDLNPPKGGRLACYDMTEYLCLAHKSQCFSYCSCGENYDKELADLASKYEKKLNELAERQQKAIDEQKENTYKKLIQESEGLEKEGKFDEAIQKLVDAKNLNENSSYWINNKISSLEQKKLELKAANEKKEEEEKKVADKNNKKENKTSDNKSDKDENKKEYIPPPEVIYSQTKQREHSQAKKRYEENAAQTHATMATIGTGIFQIWDLFQNDGNNHKYTDVCSHFAIDLGLNIISMPLALNSTTNFKDNVGIVYSTLTETSPKNPVYTNLLVGVDYYPILSNKLSVGFHSRFMGGPNIAAIAGGGATGQTGSTSSNYSASGLDFIFNTGAEIQIGHLLTAIDIIKKKWKYTESNDLFDPVLGFGSTSYADGSSFSTTLRYELGVRLFKLEKGTNLDIVVMLDNLSYFSHQGNILNLPPVFKARLWGQSTGKINLEFSPSYPVAGIPLYEKKLTSKPYFSVDLVLNITRFKLHNIEFNYDEITQSNERRGELIGYVDYNSLTSKVLTKNISGLGFSLKYKKVINSPKSENYIDFQMSGNGTLASFQNEYNEYENMRLLNFSPDFRFTKKIIPNLYIGVITGINSLSVRNSVPYYDALVKFDGQRYFLQASFGGTIGIIYSRKKSIILNYYYRPCIIGKGEERQMELEIAFKALYVNLSYIKLPNYKSGYIFDRNFNVIKAGLGYRMPW